MSGEFNKPPHNPKKEEFASDSGDPDKMDWLSSEYKRSDTDNTPEVKDTGETNPLPPGYKYEEGDK